MDPTKALLVFAEGPHDVAFVRQVFKFCFSAEKVDWKFGDYPSPFNQLFRTSVEKHAAKDLSLDMAHKFFLPDRTLVKDEWLILLFNSGGKTKTDQVKTFLKDFIPLLAQSEIFKQDARSHITEAKYLFLYDADYQNPAALVQWFEKQFSVIDDTDWRLGDFRFGTCRFGATANETAVYAWGDASGKGTLEDILLPMFEKKQKQILDKAPIFIDDCFKWNTDSENAKQAFAEKSKRKKAILTVGGQRKKPGGSLNVIIDQADLVGKDDFKADEKISAFSEFLSSWTGIRKAEGTE